MPEEIDGVVASAFKRLSPKIVDACIKNNYFVTQVVLDNQVPVKVNGVFRVPEPEYYVMIDLTKQFTYNKKEFIEHSQRLFNLFNDIERWYEC